MARKSINGGQELAQAIRGRRLDLKLTIEQAAQRAGTGTKTWSRYEAGEPIRMDKINGVCRAMEWRHLPGSPENTEQTLYLEELKHHEAWSSYLAENYGNHAAASFAVGSDIIMDNLAQELSALSELPRGSHIGQLSFSLFKDELPQQFLMRYDYDFLYRMQTVLHRLRVQLHANSFRAAHTPLEELLLYLCVEESFFLEEEGILESEDSFYAWDEWIYDLFEDSDVVMFLYGKWYVEENTPYHFDRWNESQFFCD